MTKEAAKPVLNKLKWNKSSMLETDIYIKVYLEALNKFFSIEDKQSLFIISKFFTDGAAEVGRNNFETADFNFKRGEYYHELAGKENPLLELILNNVYHRSKSFFYYKKKDYDTSIQLIETTLQNNKLLESKGFTFLLFDRVQQYYNLSRIYFSIDKSDYAFTLLSESTCFLIQWKCSILKDLNENFIRSFAPELVKIRFLLCCQFIFETAEQLQKIEEKVAFYENSKQYFISITKAAKKFKLLSTDEKFLKTWLEIISLFYDNKKKEFSQSAIEYITNAPNFYNDKPKKIMQKFIDLQ